MPPIVVIQEKDTMKIESERVGVTDIFKKKRW